MHALSRVKFYNWILKRKNFDYSSVRILRTGTVHTCTSESITGGKKKTVKRREGEIPFRTAFQIHGVAVRVPCAKSPS